MKRKRDIIENRGFKEFLVKWLLLHYLVDTKENQRTFLLHHQLP